MPSPRRLVVGISGASGVVYGVRALEALRGLGIETHLVMTRSAELTLAYETDLKLRAVHDLAAIVHPVHDVGSSISSGSFPTLGMLIAPCSIRTLSEIAYGQTTSLISRAADVVLKERRRLVLMVRESPLHLGHLRAMAAATEAGAVIAPPVPAFYAAPRTLEDLVDHTVGRCLDLFGLESGLVRRWGESEDGAAPRRAKRRGRRQAAP